MKRLLLAFLLGMVLLTSESFTRVPKVNGAILNRFHAAFATATDVRWELVGDYCKATFTEDNNTFCAFFNEDAELVATCTFIALADLPPGLRNELIKYNSTIIDLFKLDSKDDTHYYATFENSKTRTILESAGSSWKVFRKEKIR